MVTLAPGTKAPDGSLIVPRSEVVAIWLSRGVAVERIQRSIHPSSDFFTAVPPKITYLVALLVVECDSISLFAQTYGNRPRGVSVVLDLHPLGNKSGPWDEELPLCSFQQTPESSTGFEEFVSI
jgi:hypothetical protein